MGISVAHMLILGYGLDACCIIELRWPLRDLLVLSHRKPKAKNSVLVLH